MDNQTLFNQYLYGEMSDSEFEKFRLQMDADEALREEFRIHQIAYQDRESVLKTELAGVLQKEKTNVRTIDNSSSIRPLQLISRIAAVFVIGLAGYLFYQQSNSINISSSQLVDSYLSDKHLPPPVKMGEQSSSDIWDEAIRSYRSGKYIQAESQLNNLDKLNQEQNLYLGLSYLYQDPPKYLQAKDHFNKNVMDQNSVIMEQSLWYAALASLKLNDNDTAIKHLNTIIEAQSWKKDEASQLLEVLK